MIQEVRHKMKILVIDVGGTNLKFHFSECDEIRKVPSGPTMTGDQMVTDILAAVKDWPYEAVSIGYPGPVVGGKIACEPVNLGPGWMKLNLAESFGRPVKIINDAAMQALGSYEGGRMLFLGLGTGMGAALILDRVLAPLEIAHLPYKKATFEDYVGARGFERLGKKKWRAIVADVVARLKAAFVVDYVVLGGGNSKKLEEIPAGARLGDNRNAFAGGLRLWDEQFHI